MIEFLGVNWTEKEIGNFVSATERVIHFINETMISEADEGGVLKSLSRINPESIANRDLFNTSQLAAGSFIYFN